MSHAGVGSAASRFVHKRDSTRNERETLARNTPPARPRSNTRQCQSEMWPSEVETAVDRRQRLESLKAKSASLISVRGPPTSVAEDVASVAANLAQQATRPAPQTQQQRTVTFDDTQSIGGFSDDTGLGIAEQGTGPVAQKNHFLPFGTDYNSPDQELWAVVDQDHFDQQYGETVYDNPSQDYRGPAQPAYGHIIDEVQAIGVTDKEVAQHGHVHERPSHQDYGLRDREVERRQAYDQDELETRVLYVPTGTSSKEAKDSRRMEPPPAKHNVVVKAQTTAWPMKSATPAVRPKNLPNDHDPRVANFSNGINAKASSYVDDSDSNTSPSEPDTAQNRPHADLDYDSATLKTMAYASLENHEFTYDPRAPTQGPAVDEHGIPLTLPRKLANLRRMQESDIRSMFATQTDAEREETGTWFMQKIQDNMKQLMEVRLERRKIALRYELEVKKRQALVEKRTQSIEDDLNELKKKGAALINLKGDAPSR